MRVRLKAVLVTPRKTHQPDDIVELDEAEATRLIRKGVAIKVEKRLRYRPDPDLLKQ